MKLFNRRERMAGTGQGPGRAGGGLGRMGGPKAAGPLGVCRCPKCGHTQQHERGIPCTQAKCPECGTLMVRG